MALRIDANETYSRTTNVPARENYTLCAWVNFASLRSAFGGIMQCRQDGTGYTDGEFGITSGNEIYHWAGSATNSLSVTPTVGTWYWCGLFGGADQTAKIVARGSNTVTSDTAATGTQTNGVVEIGADDFTDWTDIHVGPVFAYDVVLTEAQWMHQRHYGFPVFGNVNSWLEFLNSGNLGKATIGGNFSAERGTPTQSSLAVPVLFRPPPIIIGEATGVSSASGNGDLSADASTVSGEGTLQSAGNGDVAAQSAAMSGSGIVTTGSVLAGGNIGAQASAVSGEGTSQSAGNGDIDAQAATIVGEGSVAAAGAASGNGDLAAQDSAISGSAASGVLVSPTVNPALATGSATVTPAAMSISPSPGLVLADGPDISITIEWAGNGDIASGVSTVSGSGLSKSVGSGSIDVSRAQIAGSADTGETLQVGKRHWSAVRRRKQPLKANTRAA